MCLTFGGSLQAVDFRAQTERKGGNGCGWRQGPGGKGQCGDSESDSNETFTLFREVRVFFLK